MYDGPSREYFFRALRAGKLSMLQTESRHVIAVLEVLPVACAMRLWSVNALHRRVFFVVCFIL